MGYHFSEAALFCIRIFAFDIVLSRCCVFSSSLESHHNCTEVLRYSRVSPTQKSESENLELGLKFQISEQAVLIDFDFCTYNRTVLFHNNFFGHHNRQNLDFGGKCDDLT